MVFPASSIFSSLVLALLPFGVVFVVACSYIVRKIVRDIGQKESR